MYTINELVKAAHILGYPGALISVALKETGRDKFELEEAKKIISDFANRVVTN